MIIFLVIGAGSIVLGAYTRVDSAHLHMRCVTGAGVATCELLDSLDDIVGREIYVVIAPGSILFGAFTCHDSARLHTLEVPTARVVTCELQESVDEAVRSDLVEWDEEQDTPIEEMTPTHALPPYRKD